ncbi:JNK-interacting protein 1-like isoform X1 [Nilaparvata lugens]|uniref:JNK-interacting protein 1-like isoform X1 n=1 Tax=Nilaparvata lugens TaxID=108931 RepID=UPI00193E8A20|nr:JNK-interacting protein 1-like isoform X1 [Nilaparvata lugens]
MADTEFEEFRDHLETLPQHIRAPTACYTLVHDVIVDDESPVEDELPESSLKLSRSLSKQIETTSSDEEFLYKENFRTQTPPSTAIPVTLFDRDNDEKSSSWSSSVDSIESKGRRRRRLPELPKKNFTTELQHQQLGSNQQQHETRLDWSSAVFDKTRSQQIGRPRRRLPNVPNRCVEGSSLSLAEELGDEAPPMPSGGRPRSLLMLKCHNYLREEDSSPDVDSGNSTAHSPDNVEKSVSPHHIRRNDSMTLSSASSTSLPLTQLELLEATHRGLYKFVPRHRDELEVEVGDPLYVQKEADDLWCEGVNLRTGQQGIFPSAYAVDTEYNDFDTTVPKEKRERFLLGYLGSVETLRHKGNSVLCQAVKKIVGSQHKPHSCILEVSDQGLRMVDKSKPKGRSNPCHDYFYSLKNVSFCGFHPGDHRYLCFITKHPQMQRFACHVFLGCESTRPVAESIGRAFQRFYTKFIETAYPIEDIYIE